LSDSPEQLDVLIVGAGISGIDAAYHLQQKCPSKSYAILEARTAIGGTWDLFRYPGIRSDSDMHTLGFPFRPWDGAKSIADGHSIRRYLEETAAEFGIDRQIRFGQRVTKAAWSSAEARWTVEAEASGETRRFSCAFLFLASGYYDYEQGYRPNWPGEERFRGRIFHPQHWPEGLDYRNKNVVVIGSGATAMTLVPALAETAAHVTLLQRSPSYVVSRPSLDPLAAWARRRMKLAAAERLVRWKNVLLGIFFFNLARKRPERMKRLIDKGLRSQLPSGFDAATHFNPGYNPWDQRLCLVPDGDLFEAIRRGRVSVVTDRIETFTEDGVRLASGEALTADIVVTATGLNVKLLGGIELSVDGGPVKVAERIAYKGLMLNDVPNLFLSFGYTNASWTLRSDLTSRYVCRLLNHMERRGAQVCVPRLPAGGIERRPLIDFSSGYVQRAAPVLPGQGSRRPWLVHQNYVRDLLAMELSRIGDGAMEFRKRN
jgi:monooxygenase